MAKAYVADGDGCLEVEAVSLEAARREAALIARHRECRNDVECAMQADIDRAFTRPAAIDVRLRPWDYE